MRNRWRRKMVICFIGLFPMLSIAHPFPAQLNDVKQPLTLVGKAKFSVLFWDIYDSALFSHNGEYLSDSPYLFEIKYLRDISRDDLIDRTIEQWQHLGIEKETYQPFVVELENIWPNIRKGDELAMWTDGNATAFYFNQAFKGQITDPAFSQLFASIWLSPKTSQPKLRKQLLGVN